MRGTTTSLNMLAYFVLGTGGPPPPFWFTEVCGAMGAIVRKKGFSALTASSRKPKDRFATRSVL